MSDCQTKFYYVIKAGLVLLCCVSAGNRLKLLGESQRADMTVTRCKKTHVTVQDIDTTHLATGTPVSICVVSLTNGDIFLNQKSRLSN